jgi:hypothetical protein
VGWLLRILLVILIVRAVWRLLRGVVQGLDGRGSATLEKGIALARDPVCGTYVVRSRALTVGSGDEALFFCSEKCRSQYQRS